MSAMMIDTCAWIDFLRAKKSDLGDFVAVAIKNDEARLCGVVAAELLQGCKNKTQEKQLDTLFSSILSVPTIEDDWTRCGQQMQVLRKKGVTVPLTDALIATIAKRCSLPILTIDKHFLHLNVGLISTQLNS